MYFYLACFLREQVFLFMKIRLNGQECEIENGLTLEGLLNRLSINPGRVAIEVNLEVIKKDRYKDYILNEGDIVEIVNFVGGG